MSWNTEFYGTSLKFLAGARKRIAERLPSGWSMSEGPGQGGYSALLRIRAEDGTKGDLLVRVRPTLQPRDIPTVVADARKLAKDRPVCISTTFVTPTSRERLEELGAGYVDEYGNVRVALPKPALFIASQGTEKGPKTEPRALSSLKGRAAGRVVRALCDYRPPYGIRELAERSETPLASVSRVVAFLDREGMVKRGRRGSVAEVDWKRLIPRWAQDYSLLETNEAQTFLEPRSLDELRRKLRGMKRRYVVTGALALGSRVQIAPPRLAVIYTDDVSELADDLELKPAEVGGNVIIARPFDPVVYERGETLEGLPLVAPTQLAADLLTSPGRGPAEGEELLTWMEKNDDAWRA